LYSSIAITPIDKDSEGVRYGVADEALRIALSPQDLNFFQSHKHRRLNEITWFMEKQKILASE
jgi:hypothetical protein